jgi:hypothetical protein
MTKNSIIKTINISMVFGTPPMTACVIFAAYELMVGRLAATLAFTTLSLFNILRFPLVVLPKAMRALSEALASIARIQEFLLQDVPTDHDGAVKASRPGTWIVSGATVAATACCVALLLPEASCGQSWVLVRLLLSGDLQQSCSINSSRNMQDLRSCLASTASPCSTCLAQLAALVANSVNLPYLYCLGSPKKSISTL